MEPIIRRSNAKKPKIRRLTQHLSNCDIDVKSFLLFIVITLLLFAFFYRKIIIQSEIVSVSNNFIPALSLKDSLEAILSSWNYVGLGNAGPKSEIPWQILSIIVGNNAVLAQKLYFLLPMPLSAITMYILLAYFINSNYWRSLLAFVYSVNPITISLFLAGAHGLHSSAALFPLIMLYTFKFLREGKEPRNLLLLSILVAVGTAFRVQAFLWYLLYMMAFALPDLIESRNIKYVLRILLSFLFMSGIVLLLLAPLLLVPMIRFLGGNLVTPLRGYEISGLGLMMKSFYVTFVTGDDLAAFVFATGALTFLAFVFASGRKRHKEIASLLVVINLLTFLLFSLKVTEWVPDGLVSLILFYSFNYPHILMLIISWAYVLLAAILVDKEPLSGFLSLRGFREQSFKALPRILTTLIITSLIILPIFTFNIYQPLESRNDQFYLGVDFSDGEVSPVYAEIRDWIQHTRESDETWFRTLWLPAPPTAIPFFEALVQRYDARSLMSGLDERVKYALEPLINNKTEVFGSMLAFANVKYIIVDLTAAKHYGQWARGSAFLYGNNPVGDPENYLELLSKQKDLQIVFQNDNFVVYKNTAFVLQHIAIYKNLFILNESSNISPVSMPEVYDIFGLSPNSSLVLGSNLIPANLLSYYLNISSGILESPFKQIHAIDAKSSSLWFETKMLATEAIDGDENTFWHANLGSGIGEWLEIDLGNIYQLNGFGYLTFTDREWMYQVEVSKDHSEYVQAYEKTTKEKGENEFIIHSFNNVSGRYVKFNITENFGPTPALKEFVVYTRSDEITTNSFEENVSALAPAQITREGFTSFSIKSGFKGPLYITFGETFDSGWNAYAKHVKLEHLPLPPFNTNLFYLSNDTFVEYIEISFAPQKIMDFSFIISLLGWVAVVVLIIYPLDRITCLLKRLLLKPRDAPKTH